jgi:hypothetical protein
VASRRVERLKAEHGLLIQEVQSASSATYNYQFDIRIMFVIIVDEIILILDKGVSTTYTVQGEENSPGPFLKALCRHHWLSCLVSQAYDSVRRLFVSGRTSVFRSVTAADQVDHPALERSVQKWWEEHDVPQRYLHHNDQSDKQFSFLDGPITANNPMGVHHAWGGHVITRPQYGVHLLLVQRCQAGQEFRVARGCFSL